VFQVAAVTDAGVGPSTTLIKKTKESRPGKPHNVKLDSSTLTITWNDPVVNHGTPTKYKIYKNGKHDGSVTQKSYTVPQTFVEPGQWALYWITAVNVVGEGPLSSSVNVSRAETVPGACAGIYAIPTSETSVRVSWMPPMVQNGVVIGYKLEQVKPFTKEFTPGMSLSYDIDGLSANAVYKFKVAASTKAGTGPFVSSNDVQLKMPSATTCPTPKTDPLGISTTTMARPTASPVPAKLTGQVVSSQEISLTWSLPSTLSESLIKNVIIKQTEGSSLDSQTVCCQDVRLTYRAINLHPHTTYHFNLFVHLVASGVEQKLSSYFGMTKESAPSKPVNIRASKTRNDSISLQWEAPNPANGVINLYAIFQDGRQIGNSSVTQFTVPNLEPYTIYAFRVRASTANGLLIGPLSNYYYFRTSQYLPGKMVPPRLASVSISIMYVTWDPPDHPNGELLGYRLYRKRAVNNERNPCLGDQLSHEAMVNISTQKILNERVTGLEVGTAYCFAIQARTSVGYGPLSDYAIAKTFDLAVVGATNVTCPNVNFLNDFLAWQSRLDRSIPTTEAPTTLQTDGNIIIGALSNTKEESPTVTVVVGVIAGLAVITALVLTVMLFCVCRRGYFPVSEIGSPGRVNYDPEKSFSFHLPTTSVKKTNGANGDIQQYASDDFGLQSVSQQMARAESMSEPKKEPDVPAGTSKNGSKRPIVAWPEVGLDKSSLDAPRNLYDTVTPDQPQPPGVSPPQDNEDTTETAMED
jgi:hypothetical protein